MTGSRCRLCARALVGGLASLGIIAPQPTEAVPLPELNSASASFVSQPQLVADVNPTENTDYVSTVDITAVGGGVCFSGDDGSHGMELWCSDGTGAGTGMVRDIWPGPSPGSTEISPGPAWLTAVGGTLFFVANDGKHGRELWRSDGTEAGTKMVKEIYPGNPSDPFWIHAPGSLTNVNGTLFFTADDGKHGRELWRSDGTEAGTKMVKDIQSGSGSSAPNSLANVNGTLFFAANDGVHGRELWRSDGTEAGTKMVKDIYPGLASSTPDQLMHVNGTLFFAADDGKHGRELWRSDGTEVGTEMVRDIAPGPASSGAAEPTNVGGIVMFRVGYEAARVFELWRSDGTEAGTKMVAAPGWSTMSRLTGIDGTLFFTAAPSGFGGGLWRSDGTGAGTMLVKSISPGIWPAGQSFAHIGGIVFFMAYDEHGGELWWSNGTEAGTQMAGEILPGDAHYPFPRELTAAGKTLFFVADDGIHGYDSLWKVDTDEPPTAVGDKVALAENSLATQIDVLANDPDPDGGPKSIDAVTQPTYGMVEITSEGASVTYKPEPGYCNDPPGAETDDFEYSLTPGGSRATVEVTVICAGHHHRRHHCGHRRSPRRWSRSRGKARRRHCHGDRDRRRWH